MQTNKYEQVYSSVIRAEETCNAIPMEEIANLISKETLSVAQIRDKIFPNLTHDDSEFNSITRRITSFLMHLKYYGGFDLEVTTIQSDTPITIIDRFYERIDEFGNCENIEAYDKDGNFIDVVPNPKFHRSTHMTGRTFKFKKNIYPTTTYYHLRGID